MAPYQFQRYRAPRTHEAGGAGGAVALPVCFSTELCPISSAHKNTLEILVDNSGFCKLLQAIFDFIVLTFFGQGDLIFSFYHRHWTVLVSPEYLGFK